ncbi:unnamed protein product [Vitrella brassicaformis CCMP3155]|uniref:Sugar phosphate transporter domain-containing protein n=1 Tax=Vitrella brassicaformis (strain CCMP3155) TaxID=1169540 RepID=A0A0G4GG86_VITBC|nr:unnamed protein product [Vitrella brassicaformis CCMP3155]|eukprot:CEM28638.1 unnamed protein product [Vitrella brassicaformis CCMP3155]
MGMDRRAEEVLSAMAFYFVISLSIVFLNFHIFSSTFQNPVFVSWFQQIVALVCVVVMGQVGKCNPSLAFFPPYEFKLKTARAVLPVTVTFVAMIAFANTCLKNVQVSTYQVARSTTILFNILLMYVVLGKSTSRKAILACMVVVLGFIVGSLDPTTLSPGGVILGLMSSVTQALYNVYIKKVLEVCDNNQNLMLAYNVTMAIPLFFPCIYIAGEGNWANELPWDFSVSDTWQMWGTFVLSGLLAILINIATFLMIKVTNPVTFNMVAMVKACAQSIGGIVLFGEVVSWQSLSGIALTILGSYWYSMIKLAESKQPTASTPPPLPLHTQTNNGFTKVSTYDSDDKRANSEMSTQPDSPPPSHTDPDLNGEASSSETSKLVGSAGSHSHPPPPPPRHTLNHHTNDQQSSQAMDSDMSAASGSTHQARRVAGKAMARPVSSREDVRLLPHDPTEERTGEDVDSSDSLRDPKKDFQHVTFWQYLFGK